MTFLLTCQVSKIYLRGHRTLGECRYRTVAALVRTRKVDAASESKVAKESMCSSATFFVPSFRPPFSGRNRDRAVFVPPASK
jgi:hypothetical protein